MSEPKNNQDEVGRGQTITIVTPAYNEAANLERMYSEMVHAMAAEEWGWLIIDDHSSDGTYRVAASLAEKDSRVRCVRLSRNFGSHAAATCGLHDAPGDCAVLMAADLQDPPDVIPALLKEWRRGADVVWAVRAGYDGRSRTQGIVARLYHSWMGKLSGLGRLPEEGSDYVLVNRNVLDALKRIPERNATVLGLIAWLGFRHSYIPYTKRVREFGRSGWTFRRKMKLAIDSMIAFSYLPMRAIMWFGTIVAALGFAYAIIVLIGGLRGSTVEGWSSTIMAVLVLGGIQMIMIGIIGQYLWRVLDEIRQRPLYVVEQETPIKPGEASQRQLKQESD